MILQNTLSIVILDSREKTQIKLVTLMSLNSMVLRPLIAIPTLMLANQKSSLQHRKPLDPMMYSLMDLLLPISLASLQDTAQYKVVKS